MSGLSDYTAKNELNYLTGQVAQPALPTVWLALFTAVGTDAGGFSEVSGGAYARTQCSGTLQTNGTTAGGNAILHFGTVPSWVTAGMSVYEVTSGTLIPASTTVLSFTSTTVTMSANAAGTINNGDTIAFSAFAAATGSQPSTDQNNAIVTFAQATANWGTVIAFGLYDGSAAGNLLLWDFLGNFAWLPASVSAASPAVFTTKAHGYSANDPVVDSVEFGGTQPTLSQGSLTSYAVNFVAAAPGTDTFSLQQPAGGANVNASATGAVMVRKLTQQSIPANVTASFAVSSFTLNAA